jgi:hypothetical protein
VSRPAVPPAWKRGDRQIVDRIAARQRAERPGAVQHHRQPAGAEPRHLFARFVSRRCRWRRHATGAEQVLELAQRLVGLRAIDPGRAGDRIEHLAASGPEESEEPVAVDPHPQSVAAL